MAVVKSLAGPLARRIHNPSRRDDACYLLCHRGRGVGFGWVRFSGSLPMECSGLNLGLAASEVCIFDVCLAPVFSGGELHLAFLLALRRQFADHPVLAYAGVDNATLCEDLLKAGFEPWIEIVTVRRWGGRLPMSLRFPQPRRSSEPLKAAGEGQRDRLTLLTAGAAAAARGQQGISGFGGS